MQRVSSSTSARTLSLRCGFIRQRADSSAGAGKRTSRLRRPARVMNRLAKLSARFIGERGFSIGVDDVTPAALLQRRKRAIISQSYVQCEVGRFCICIVLMP